MPVVHRGPLVGLCADNECIHADSRQARVRVHRWRELQAILLVSVLTLSLSFSSPLLHRSELLWSCRSQESDSSADAHYAEAFSAALRGQTAGLLWLPVTRSKAPVCNAPLCDFLLVTLLIWLWRTVSDGCNLRPLWPPMSVAVINQHYFSAC